MECCNTGYNYVENAMKRTTVMLPEDLKNRAIRHANAIGISLGVFIRESLEKAVLMDILPTLFMYENTDMSFARGYFHWFCLIQPYDFPERLIRFLFISTR